MTERDKAVLAMWKLDNAMIEAGEAMLTAAELDELRGWELEQAQD